MLPVLNRKESVTRMNHPFFCFKGIPRFIPDTFVNPSIFTMAEPRRIEPLSEWPLMATATKPEWKEVKSRWGHLKGIPQADAVARAEMFFMDFQKRSSGL